MKIKKTSVQQPNTSIGIMRFFDGDAAGPQISPEIVIVAAGILIGVVLILHTIPLQ
ncbi:MAG: preprotein translocase subunit Sec61beta [Candidatus Diapherotrites archaeon]|nr:preprotein translocase subunit Sec61beta [Candidatus Diapherotrites archaeon]